MWIFLGNGQQRIADFCHVDAVCNADRDAEAHAPVAVCPIGYGRIYELRVLIDHHDVVIGANDCAARANMLPLSCNARHFDAVPNSDWSLCQNHQATDEVTGDILQTEPHADANRTGEDSQRSQTNPAVLQDNENAYYQHDVANHLGNRVLQRTIESALGKQPVKKKTLRPG